MTTSYADGVQKKKPSHHNHADEVGGVRHIGVEPCVASYADNVGIGDRYRAGTVWSVGPGPCSGRSGRICTSVAPSTDVTLGRTLKCKSPWRCSRSGTPRRRPVRRAWSAGPTRSRGRCQAPKRNERTDYHIDLRELPLMLALAPPRLRTTRHIDTSLRAGKIAVAPQCGAARAAPHGVTGAAFPVAAPTW